MATGDNDTNDDGIDLEELMGKLLDDRGLTTERLSMLDGIQDKLDGIAKSSKRAPAPSTTSGTTAGSVSLEDVQALLDEKLSEAMATVNAPKKGALARWLGL